MERRMVDVSIRMFAEQTTSCALSPTNSPQIPSKIQRPPLLPAPGLALPFVYSSAFGFLFFCFSMSSRSFLSLSISSSKSLILNLLVYYASDFPSLIPLSLACITSADSGVSSPSPSAPASAPASASASSAFLPAIKSSLAFLSFSSSYFSAKLARYFFFSAASF